MSIQVVQHFEETKIRFITFLTKIEERLLAYTAQDYQSLLQLKITDTSQHQQAFVLYKMKVLGQLDRLNKKATTVLEEEIKNIPLPCKESTACIDQIKQVKEDCYLLHFKLDELHGICRTKIQNL